MGLVAALALGLGAQGAWTLTLNGQLAPAPAAAVNSPCPEHSGYECRATAREASHLPTGGNTHFENAWNTVLPREWDPAGWTLNWSTEPLDAVLNITTYGAFNYKPGDPQYGSFYAGAEIRIEWTPSADQQDLKWIQALHTNRTRYTGKQWYLDIATFTKDRPPVYPYQYADLRFYDKPSRWCEADQHIFWDAYLYLARVDRTAMSVTVYEGVCWGFTIDCLPVPEPSGLLAFAGGGWMLLALRRRG